MLYRVVYCEVKILGSVCLFVQILIYLKFGKIFYEFK
jgi:hypothetical protein